TVELTFTPAEGEAGRARRVAVVPLLDERPLRWLRTGTALVHTPARPVRKLIMPSPSTAGLVSEIVATALAGPPGNCTDPGCARHAGTMECLPFETSRSAGDVFGEAVAAAWFSAGGSRLDIPAGIVAALALWPVKSPGAEHADTLASYIAAQPPRVLVRGLAECADSYWGLRPDLWEVSRPLFDWTREDLNSTQLNGVMAVTKAALRHGVLRHTGDSDPGQRSHIDLMSWVITNLRHHQSRRTMGEYHTPPDISDLVTTMLAAESTGWARPQGEAFIEPTAGTGGLFRSAAQDLRRNGENPADFAWVMLELDPLAAAAAAVNAIVWGLGPRAVVACGDVLVDADLDREARTRRRELARHRDDLAELIGFAVATQTTDQLLRSLLAPQEKPDAGATAGPSGGTDV
ncbi:N-6 DNA methylase, partial [Streptomyces sp. NPDC047072]|uniref:N-6 DNA methylase n=1 Tax=Streptomyces sp. NPDC047072 TaxID=3154809 RepID=UPI0033C8F874